MAKREYIGMAMTQVEIEPCQPILDGSVTAVQIEVNNVEVQPFEQGFGTDATNDFKEISFD